MYEQNGIINKEIENLKKKPKIIPESEIKRLKKVQKKRMEKSKQPKGPIGHLLNQHIHCGCPRGEEREKGAERIFEILITENFPNLIKDITIKSVKQLDRL